jgi:hypothetical protein
LLLRLLALAALIVHDCRPNARLTRPGNLSDHGFAGGTAQAQVQIASSSSLIATSVVLLICQVRNSGHLIR